MSRSCSCSHALPSQGADPFPRDALLPSSSTPASSSIPRAPSASWQRDLSPPSLQGAGILLHARNPCYEHKVMETFPRGELGSQGRAGGMGSTDVGWAGSPRGWGRGAGIWPFPLWAPRAAQLRSSRFSMPSPGGSGCRTRPCSASPRPRASAR